MKRLNNFFIIFILLIGLLSIAYIWKAEENKKALEMNINKQSQEIDSLKSKLEKIENEKNAENIKGATTTAIGTIIGSINFKNLDAINTTIVCAQDKFTEKEFCTDNLIKTANKNIFEYSLEIPVSKYLIYAIEPSNSEKIFYSKVLKCSDDGNCENSQKILLEVFTNEIQKDININF